MKRKFKYIFRILYNLLRLPLVSFFNLFKIKFYFIQLISIHAKLTSYNGGKIRLVGKNTIEDNTLIQSSGGSITIKNAFINRNCTIVSLGEILIENNVTIGPNVCIYDHDHNFKKEKNGDFIVKKVIIKENVWIGANVSILKGVTIGENAVIGAGTVVTKDVLPNSIYTNKNNLSI